MEGWEGAGDNRDEGMAPTDAVDRFRGPWLVECNTPVSNNNPPLLLLLSPKLNLLVMTGMAEWGCGVWGVWGVGRPGILKEEDDEFVEVGILLEVLWMSVVALITLCVASDGIWRPCNSAWNDQL